MMGKKHEYEVKVIQINGQVMRSIEKDPPPVGTLCLLYFPVGEHLLTGKKPGPVAVAYKTDGGWKMADTPTPLRGLLGEVGPSYWLEMIF